MLRKNIVGLIGIFCGATAFLIALVHFWAGPFSVLPIEVTIANKAAAIKTATLAALQGKTVVNSHAEKEYSIDTMLYILVTVLGLTGAVMGFIAGICKENKWAIYGALTLGLGAIAFQIATIWFALIFAIFLLMCLVSFLS